MSQLNPELPRTCHNLTRTCHNLTRNSLPQIEFKPACVTRAEFISGMKKERIASAEGLKVYTGWSTCQQINPNMSQLNPEFTPKSALHTFDTGFLEPAEFREFYKFCFQFNREGTIKVPLTCHNYQHEPPLSVLSRTLPNRTHNLSQLNPNFSHASLIHSLTHSRLKCNPTTIRRISRRNW
jgi:hypothetical protein